MFYLSEIIIYVLKNSFSFYYLKMARRPRTRSMTRAARRRARKNPWIRHMKRTCAPMYRRGKTV